MKKDVPNVFKLSLPKGSNQLTEALFIHRFKQMEENGYIFPQFDFDLYLAIMIRQRGIENVPNIFIDHIIRNGEIRSEIKFNMIALARQLDEDISDEDWFFYFDTQYNRLQAKKKIIKIEVNRTHFNFRKEDFTKTSFYRELFKMVANFDDMTLIDWYVPIVLTFEKFTHIYIKHVEETKFGEGQFKRRSFFDYDHTQILTLLKKILNQEEKEIKDHFMDVSIGRNLNDESWIKDYHRGFGKFPPIVLGEDKFRLSINKDGFIESFYQLK